MSEAIEQQAKAYPAHDCSAWNTEHWHNSAVANWTTCGVCGNVTAFRYKRFWKRLRAFLFSRAARP